MLLIIKDAILCEINYKIAFYSINTIFAACDIKS